MDYAKESLRLHEEWKGKIRVDSAVPVKTMQDLSLAYTPGVAQPCLEIAKDPANAYKYTSKSHLVAIVTDGSAVLGLGNIGGMAGMPVMEGKAFPPRTPRKSSPRCAPLRPPSAESTLRTSARPAALKLRSALSASLTFRCSTTTNTALPSSSPQH